MFRIIHGSYGPTASKIVILTIRCGFRVLRDGERLRSREGPLAAQGIFPSQTRNQLNEVDMADERSRSDDPNGRRSL